MTDEEKAKKELLKIYKEKGYVSYLDLVNTTFEYFVETKELESFLNQQGIEVIDQMIEQHENEVDETEDFDNDEVLSLDDVKKILLQKGKVSGTVDQADIYDALCHSNLNDDDIENLVHFLGENNIEVVSDEDVEEGNSHKDEEEELGQEYYFEEDEEILDKESEDPKIVYERIKDSNNALKIEQNQWVFLQTTEFGGIDYVYGDTYSYKVGLLVNVDEQKKTFRIGIMIGPGDSLPASPIPCYLNETFSIDFVLRWLAKNKSDVTYFLHPSTKDDYYLLKKQIKKQFSPLVKEIHTFLDDGTPYDDRIVPNEIELIEGADKSRLDCVLPKRLDLHADGINTWLSCEAGSTSNEIDLKSTDFSMLLWALKKLFIKAI